MPISGYISTTYGIFLSTKEKPLKLSDGGGLHLLVQPSGRKVWRFRYRFAGRENMLAFGTFPVVSLAEARRKRDEARKLLSDGTDPAVKRRLDRIAAAASAQRRARSARTTGCWRTWPHR